MDIFYMVMKVNIKLVFGLCMMPFIMASCQNTSDIEVYYYEQKANVIPSPIFKHDLPQSLAYGKVIPATVPDTCKAEANLLAQVRTYHSALLHGDIGTCYRFLYPDALTYCKRFYSGLSDAEIIKELYAVISDNLQESLVTWREHGVEYEMVVPTLKRKVVKGNDIIIVFDIISNMCSDDVFIHSTDNDKTLGISQDCGENWWFMSIQDDTPTILRMHYNGDFVSAVMEY